jgi:hypothetical protein
MKYSFLLLALIVACSKPMGSSSHKSVKAPNPIQNPAPIEDIADPLTTPDEQQQQTDDDFTLNQTYNGTNVVLNYNSSRSLGMIRIKGKDAEKLNKYMALSTIKLESQNIKSELEAKVGQHVMCRPDTCWVYIDYKNGDVVENKKLSEAAKAPRIIFPYKGQNLELHMIGRKGRIFFDGMDAKALYSVMELREDSTGGKGSASTIKAGEGIECRKIGATKADQKDT